MIFEYEPDDPNETIYHPDDKMYLFKRFDLSRVEPDDREPLFSTNQTHSEMEFFEFDESHVIYKLKCARTFHVNCIKTGEKLWTLKPNADSSNLVRFVLRELSDDGLLLMNEIGGPIR